MLKNADKKQIIQKIPPFEYADGKRGDIPVLKVFNGWHHSLCSRSVVDDILPIKDEIYPRVDEFSRQWMRCTVAESVVDDI